MSTNGLQTPNPRRRSRWPRIIATALIAVGVVWLLVGLATKTGRNFGEASAQQAIERLALVWPDFMGWPVHEKSVIAGLAMTCRLHLQEATREKTIECLKRAADDPDATLPRDVTREQAETMLELLLAAAPRDVPTEKE